MRKFRKQSLLQFVYPQHISVVQLSLTIRRQFHAAQIRQLTVHVPFHIFDIGAVQHCRHAFKSMISDFLPGQIQYILIPAQASYTARNGDCPVGMLSVQIRIRRDHLRFEPDTELKSHGIYPIHQKFQTSRQLFLIDFPVTQARAVIITVSEPTIVHDQHFDPKL